MPIPVAFRWLALVIAVAACGQAPQPAAETTADSAAIQDTSASASLAQMTTVAAASRAVDVGVGPFAFRHEKHRSLNCDRCHTAVPGHSAHGNVACSSCHAPVPVTGPAPTPADCATCHHANSQQRPCRSCHPAASTLVASRPAAPVASRPAVPTPGALTPGALTLDVTWKFSVSAAPVQRQVRFDHGWHANLQCTDCHVNQPRLVPTRECGSCHQHHDGTPDCRTCHQPPPVGAHTAAVHNGCAGSGCHQDPPVKVATLSRNECLLCHADRVNHEPGKVCAKCHMLQLPGSSPAARPPGIR